MIEKQCPRILFTAAVSLALLAIPGCSQDTIVHDAYVEIENSPQSQEGTETQPQEVTETQSTDTSTKPAPEITLEVAGIDEYNALIEKHKGQVILVDFWATWCLPCKKQFPHTVELAKQYADQGLITISVSFDAEKAEENVLKYLKDQNATFHNLRSKYGAGTESMDAFELDASVPHYRLYDRQGNLVYKKDAKPIGIEEKIEELLGQK